MQLFSLYDPCPRFFHILKRYSQYVPKHKPVSEQDIQLLGNFIESHSRILILTGAGISTESGIPDYRSEEVGLYARTNHKPIQYQEFLKSSAVRKRYWARNYVGWDRFSKCQPNQTHVIIRDLELVRNKVTSVITQNVDNLHFKAGSRNVIELHGSAFRVICLNCKGVYSRFDVQKQLLELNPTMKETAKMIRPDGDVELSQDQVDVFTPPICVQCNQEGILKPDITFFGDNVPKSRVDQVKQYVSASDAILVLGSSLSVFSGYRIILQAAEEKKPIAIVSIGPTRADDKASLKISGKCGDILSKIC